MLVSDKQLTLGQLIDKLEAHKGTKLVQYDFADFRPIGVDSYRGYYEDLAIGYESDANVTVDALLQSLKDAVGKKFQGYKGGTYTMDRDTAIWVSDYGRASDTIITDVIANDWRVVLVTQIAM